MAALTKFQSERWFSPSVVVAVRRDVVHKVLGIELPPEMASRVVQVIRGTSF
jgi:hypothetical protein